MKIREALDTDRLALEILHQDGPIDVGARGLVHAIVAHIANDADDLDASRQRR